MKQMSFKIEDDSIVIKVPIELLKFAGENNPDNPLVVSNENEFAKKVLFELEHNLGSPESGNSGFQQLLDEAMFEVAQDGNDCVGFKEEQLNK